MTRGARIALWTFAGMAAFCLAAWLAFATWVWRAGCFTVRIADHREGVDLTLPVPAAVLEGAAIVAPLAVRATDPQAARDLRRHVAPLEPLLRDLAAELEAAPDMTFVEVRDRQDRVWVRKEGGRLKVEVEEPGARIEVSVPEATLRRIIERLS